MRPPSRSRRRTPTFAPQFLQVALCPGGPLQQVVQQCPPLLAGQAHDLVGGGPGSATSKSRHLHLGSLGRYVQLGEQTSAQVTADAGPAARRRIR